jgi:hypothetical protein
MVKDGEQRAASGKKPRMANEKNSEWRIANGEWWVICRGAAVLRPCRLHRGISPADHRLR